MRRHTRRPRDNWQAIVERQGLLYHSIDGRKYWDESVYYAFTPAEIDEVERATRMLDRLCLRAVRHVIENDRFDEFSVPEALRPWVRASWDRDEISIYGRFDFSFDGTRAPKLLEFNADTPTSLVEASVVQWYWLQDCYPQADQFNALHERLIEAWRRLAPETNGHVHFAGVGNAQEDFMTVAYLQDTAQQAGLRTTYLDINQIGFDARTRSFVDLQNQPLRTCFKLYPWEWLSREAFGVRLPDAFTRWLEPPWKMLLSNKALLVVLYELFPDCPYLLPASFEPMTGEAHVRKPTLSREGANVRIVDAAGRAAETDGPYEGPYVYQAFAPLPAFDGYHPVIGSWLVNGHACGMGIREDESLVTGNASRFVPHRIEGGSQKEK